MAEGWANFGCEPKPPVIGIEISPAPRPHDVHEIQMFELPAAPAKLWFSSIASTTLAADSTTFARRIFQTISHRAQHTLEPGPTIAIVARKSVPPKSFTLGRDHHGRGPSALPLMAATAAWSRVSTSGRSSRSTSPR